MRFYVICKLHLNEQERIYVNFEGTPKTRAQIPPYFTLQCPRMPHMVMAYYPQDVKAEPGTPIAGAAVGALLFLVDPLLGLAGMIFGGLLNNATEETDVNTFNNS